MTSPFTQARSGVSVSTEPFWMDLQTRLTTPETLEILQDGRPDLHPLGRVYRGTEDYSKAVGDANRKWGRQVIVPTATLWPSTETEPGWRGVGWLVRSEMNAPPGTNPGLGLGRLQQIAFGVSVGWAPKNAARGYMTVRPVWRERGPQSMPEWDVERELWWLSSEYRVEITRI